MKTAIVTGASRGLGEQIVHKLLGAGFGVVGWSRTSPIPVDVTDSSQVEKRVVDILAETGKIDVLINNAGFVQSLSPLQLTSEEDLRNAFQTNVYGPFYTMRSVIPSMVKRNEGLIINIASKSAIYPVPKLAVYSASKSALLTLTQATAKELRETKVLCLAVCPAGMRNAMRAAVYGDENAQVQQSTQRVADIVHEIVSNGTASGKTVGQGSCILIRRDQVEIREMQDG